MWIRIQEMAMQFTLNVLLTAGVFIAASAVVGLLMERLILRRLMALTRHTPWEYDDIVITSLRGLTFYACLLTGIYGALMQLPVDERAHHIAGKLILVFFLMLATVLMMRMSAGFVLYYAKKTVLPSPSIFTNLAKITAFSIGLLIILQSLGISITPLLTALGVGGLAVALALQDTLSNIFSGLQIIATRQIRQGDYIRLSGGEEGYVTDITWRNTLVRALANNLVLIPNSKLAGAIITNYQLPDTDMGVLVQVGVSYDSDLEKVERITVDVARALLRDVQGGVSGFEPFIRYHTFAEFSINFTVILRCQEYVDQYLVKHEFVKRLHSRYRDERIEIPFPIQTVHLKKQE